MDWVGTLRQPPPRQGRLGYGANGEQHPGSCEPWAHKHREGYAGARLGNLGTGAGAFAGMGVGGNATPTTAEAGTPRL
jgi:hypothetical protein